MASFNWTASSDANFDRYQLPMTPGPGFDTVTAVVVDSFADIATLAATTTQGLETPGQTATFRVYVVTTTGNEKGSNDVTITRP